MSQYGDTVMFLLTDHLGSSSIVTDAQGAKIGEVRYKAWGETRYDSGNVPTKQRFTGQREDSELGLIYYGARWYDPSIGRFNQADTIIPQPGNALAWDRYSYTSDNPVRYNDPSGHDANMPGCNGPYGSDCSANRYPWKSIMAKGTAKRISENYHPAYLMNQVIGEDSCSVLPPP